MNWRTASIPYASQRKEDMFSPNAVPCPVATMVPSSLVAMTHPKLPLPSLALPSVAMINLECRVANIDSRSEWIVCRVRSSRSQCWSVRM